MPPAARAPRPAPSRSARRRRLGACRAARAVPGVPTLRGALEGLAGGGVLAVDEEQEAATEEADGAGGGWWDESDAERLERLERARALKLWKALSKGGAESPAAAVDQALPRAWLGALGVAALDAHADGALGWSGGRGAASAARRLVDAHVHGAAPEEPKARDALEVVFALALPADAGVLPPDAATLASAAAVAIAKDGGGPPAELADEAAGRLAASAPPVSSATLARAEQLRNERLKAEVRKSRGAAPTGKQWKCVACGTDANFPTRTECRTCGAPRPDA